MEYEFYIVATPIGNMADISLRALEVLKNVDFIACEDTRVSKKLFEKYSINAKLIDCHKFNEKERSGKIISLIKEGNKTALVSDAGTPLISDPGSVLIGELIANGVKITSIPGACAVSTFLSQIPRDTEEYAFIGFVPRTKQGQEEVFSKHKYTNLVFYDSPNRFMNTLNNILEIYSPEKKVAIGRELTKMYEEIRIDTVQNLIRYYRENPLKGELVAMLFKEEYQTTDETELYEKINILKKEGFSQKDITKIISKLYNVNKNLIYKMSLE